MVSGQYWPLTTDHWNKMTRIAQILSTGSYVPERVVTNAEIDAILGEATSDWLVANVGIRERRWICLLYTSRCV